MWLEDSAKVPGVRDFARAVANMVAVRMAEAADLGLATRRSVAVRSAAEPEAVHSFTAELALRGLDHSTIGTELFADVSVLVLRFTDPVAMAHRQESEAANLADRIAAELQSIGAEHSIRYLKFMGEEVVCAAGFGAGDAGAPGRIAGAALVMRDRCTALFEATDLAPSFRMGIDCGIAMGSPVGRGPRLFNIWGDAPRTAAAMAGSAPAGTIQVTEAAYQRLTQDFLFRPRGSFYIPRVGAARTFVLAGRL